MKKLFSIFATFAMLCAVGCEEQGGGEQPEDPIPENIFFGLDKESVTFSPDGGSVDVVVYSNYKWEISGTSDWCTPSATSGEANEDGQKVSFSADVAYDNREATFWFRCADEKIKFTVSQSFKEVIIADENNTFSVPVEGGVAVLNYQTTVECEVIIPEEAKSWISLTPATRALVSESATLTVAENTTYSERSAVVKVVKVGDNTLFAEYTINQVQNDAVIADDNNTFNIDGLPQSVTLGYKTNVECDVIIPEEAKSWISLAPATRALVNKSATLNITDNNTGAKRSAVVKVVAANNNELFAEYTITQAQRYYIEYTSTDGSTITPYTPYSRDAFGATIIRNEYIDGKGYIDFDAPVTAIGYQAFYECTSLTSITIPDSVTAIGYEAFRGCTSLPSITIPDSVTSIGYQAFYNCDSLTSVTIGNGVTEIGSKAFSGCTGELIINSKIVEENYSNGNYPQKDGWLSGAKFTKLTIGDSVTSIGEWVFSGCTSLTSITIPDSVTSIGVQAFYYCTSLTSVTIPDSVTSIGSEAFSDCTSLTSITIPDSVTSIGEGAFSNCDSLASVTIPDSVTEIGYGAFYYCTSLTSVTIGNGVTSIDHYAFKYCTSLKEVYCKATTPPTGGSYMFDSNASGRKIYVPRASVNAYKSAEYWKNYASYIVGYDF